MKLGTVEYHRAAHAAVFRTQGEVRVFAFPSAAEAINFGIASSGSLLTAEPLDIVDESEVSVLAPLLRPGRILGSGINYRSHQGENPSAVMPVEPAFFSKLPSSVIGPGAEIQLPAAESHLDYEVEIAIVIGASGKSIHRGAAFDHMFGYTVVNDISGRDAQFHPNQMDLGKGFDTFCPMGPWIVTRDDIDSPNDAWVRSWVNGELRQDATTADWIYDIPALIEHASRNLTLESGDLITTGTPAGCGMFRDPPVWLRHGDEVTIEAGGTGRAPNPIVQGR